MKWTEKREYMLMNVCIVSTKQLASFSYNLIKSFAFPTLMGQGHMYDSLEWPESDTRYGWIKWYAWISATAGYTVSLNFFSCPFNILNILHFFKQSC